MQETVKSRGGCFSVQRHAASQHTSCNSLQYDWWKRPREAAVWRSITEQQGIIHSPNAGDPPGLLFATLQHVLSLVPDVTLRSHVACQTYPPQHVPVRSALQQIDERFWNSGQRERYGVN